MPGDNQSDEAKLRKLGQRIRLGWAKRHPVSERSLQTVRDAVRVQQQRAHPVQPPPPSPGKQPPGLGR